MEKIKIGKIVNAVALKGEVKVYNYSDYKERYEELDTIIVENKQMNIEKVRYQQKMVILKLEGVDDRNQAEALKNKEIFISEKEMRELPEDTFYIKDLVGLRVIDTESEHEIGVVTDVLQNSAHDIYQVKLQTGKDGYIPAISQFVKEVSVDNGYIKVQLIEGLIEE